MDCYRDMEDVQATFVEFMDRVPFYGTVVACTDNDALRNLLPRVERRVLSYGTREDADFRAFDVKTEHAPEAMHNTLRRELQGPRPGPLRSLCPRRPQYSERHGGHRGRHGPGDSGGAHSRRDRPIPRSRPPLPKEGRSRRRASGRRLRPSPDRDSGNAGGGPAVVWNGGERASRTHPRHLSAAPLHPHLPADG